MFLPQKIITNVVSYTREFLNRQLFVITSQLVFFMKLSFPVGTYILVIIKLYLLCQNPTLIEASEKKKQFK